MFDVFVGVQEWTGVRSTFTRILSRHGALRSFLRAGVSLTATLRLIGRKVGISLSGFLTVEEILLVQRAREFKFTSINDPDTCARMQGLRPDWIIVAGFGEILRKPVLAIPRKGVLNVHPSFLPQYRGPTPCYWVIKNKEKTTGVTVHHVDEGIDTGDIIRQVEVPIRHHESERSLEQRLSTLGARVLIETLDSLTAGNATRTKQIQEDSSYFSFPRKDKFVAQRLRPRS
jgi:methionyl-tRNA formyltransferase